MELLLKNPWYIVLLRYISNLLHVCHCNAVRDCMNWFSLLIAQVISGLVIVRYCNDTTISCKECYKQKDSLSCTNKFTEDTIGVGQLLISKKFVFLSRSPLYLSLIET